MRQKHFPLIATYCCMIGAFFILWMRFPTNFLIIGAILALFSPDIRKRLSTFLYTPVFWGALLLLLLYAVGSVIGKHLYGTHYDAWHHFSHAGYMVIVFLGLMSMQSQPAWKDRIINAFIIGTAIGCLALIWSTYHGYTLLNIPLFGSHFHVSVTRYDAIGSSTLIAFAIYFALYQLTQKKWPFTHYLLLPCAIVMLYYLLIINIERTGDLALFVLLILLILQKLSFKKASLAFIGLIALAILTYTFSPNVHYRTNNAIKSATHFFILLGSHNTKAQQDSALTSVGERLHIAKESLSLIRQRPLLGHGTLGFPNAYGSLHDPIMKLSGRQYNIGNPDNSYIQLSVENGILGLLIAFIFFLLAYRQCRQNALIDKHQHWVMAILIGIAIAGLSSSTFGNYRIRFFLFAFLGFLLARHMSTPSLSKDTVTHKIPTSSV